MSTEKKQQRRIRRDRRRERRKVYANPHIHRFLRFVVRQILLSVFHVRTVDLDVVNRASGPFIIMGNHSAVIDPLILGMFINKPIHFVVSDSQFRSPLLGWILNLTGSIPKTKAMSDLDTIKKIVAVKSAGGVIGSFPEGQSSWDGQALPIMRATDKLIKSLKIPVYIARIEGAYLAWPRWARRFRRGPVRITYSRLFSASDLRELSVTEVGVQVKKALAVDPFAFQENAKFRYRGPRQAEYLERVLFVCPSCHSIGTLVSNRRRVRCTACNHTDHFNVHGFFEARRGSTHFATIARWNQWQLTWFTEYLASARSGPLLTEEGFIVGEGYKTQPLRTLGQAALSLYTDRLEIAIEGSAPSAIPLNAIEGINVQNNEHLEFYHSNSLYRLSPVSPRGNTLKWDHAMRVLSGLRNNTP